MNSDTENDFFNYFKLSDREKDLIEKYKRLQDFTARTDSFPFFLCSIKDYDGVKKCVDDGFKIKTYLNGVSLLSIAAANNDEEMIAYLFNNGFRIESDQEYLHYLIPSLEKSHFAIFDLLINDFDRFTLSEGDVVTIVSKSLIDIHFIKEIIRCGIHLNSDGESLFSDVVNVWVKREVLNFLLSNKMINTESCNELYVSVIEEPHYDGAIEGLKLLSPYCENIDDIPSQFDERSSVETIKFILSDRKYSNTDWICDYFRYQSNTESKTEVLRFILNGDFDSDFLSSIMYAVIVDHSMELGVLLEYIGKLDSNCLNQKNYTGYTVIHEILGKPDDYTFDILSAAIANGYDVNIPTTRNDWNGDEEDMATLEVFFNGNVFEEVFDESAKEITHLILSNTSIGKELIDKMIDRFLSYRRNFSETECDFLNYINSVYEGRSDCPSFFSENYSEEIIKNEYINLLPQTAKDIFVFP